MSSPSDDSVFEPRPERWLRLAKLLLTVILLAIAVWRALSGLFPA